MFWALQIIDYSTGLSIPLQYPNTHSNSKFSSSGNLFSYDLQNKAQWKIRKSRKSEISLNFPQEQDFSYP